MGYPLLTITIFNTQPLRKYLRATVGNGPPDDPFSQLRDFPFDTNLFSHLSSHADSFPKGTPKTLDTCFQFTHE